VVWEHEQWTRRDWISSRRRHLLGALHLGWKLLANCRCRSRHRHFAEWDFQFVQRQRLQLRGPRRDEPHVERGLCHEAEPDAAIQYSGTTVSLPATYGDNYELTPSLSIVAGTYSGYTVTSGGAEAATATISASGTVTGSSASGCTFSGITAPRSNGNVYNLSVTFAGGSCANGTATVTGIGYWDAGGGKLYSAALNASRSNGFLFVANRTANDPSAAIITAFTANVLASEQSGFEQDESAIDNRLSAAGQYQSGNHVIEYKANLLKHAQQSFDRQVADIINLSAQQELRRATVVPLVTKLGDDWSVLMNDKTTTHLSFATASLISSTKSELAAGIAQARDSAIAALDSRIVWVF
jgi:hypothetical protein